MKISKYFFISIFAILIVGGFIFFIFKNNSNTSISNNQNNNTQYARTSTENNTVNNQTNENTILNTQSNTSVEEQTANNVEPKVNEQPEPPIEEDLSSFSSKIYSKDSNRQKNLQITSSILNGKIIEPGQTFSFTKTVGKATPQKGYKEADIYDKDGNKIKGYGGGNCQISSTLYNAVLALPSLKVTERHPHSKKVPYVKEGKDAAVAYGSIDFKFINNYNFSVKIYCSVDSKNVYIRIVKLS